jgi:hypothetical protein
MIRALFALFLLLTFCLPKLAEIEDYKL